ncbi:MAG: hypothetical protein AB1Z98_28450 [Nannocystaceae bacterium]
MLSRRLGAATPMPPALAEHLRDCLACQVEHRTFATLDEHAVEPSADFAASVRRALDDLRR